MQQFGQQGQEHGAKSECKQDLQSVFLNMRQWTRVLAKSDNQAAESSKANGNFGNNLQ